LSLATSFLQGLRGRKASRDRPILFIHIPKTGGITFRHILQQLYGDSYVYCEDPRVAEIEKILVPGACVEMHVGTYEGELRSWFHGQLLQEQNWSILEKVDIFVMFRNPLDQALSAYRYYVQTLKNRAETRGSRLVNTVEEFFSSPYTQNMQLAFFLGEKETVRGKELTASDLNRAKRLIEQLDIKIGILEQYAKSVQLLEAVTGREVAQRTIEIQNRSVPDAIDNDESLRAYISARNGLDQELYLYATRLFDQQLATYRIEAQPQLRFV